MAVGELSLSDAPIDLWKEVRVGAIVGAALGLFNVFWRWFLTGNIKVSVTVGISLFITVVMAKTVGSMLPMLAKSLRLDPALMASPLITTLVDAGSLMVYFNMSKALLGI
jgi:magnesium transporter